MKSFWSIDVKYDKSIVMSQRCLPGGPQADGHYNWNYKL